MHASSAEQCEPKVGHDRAEDGHGEYEFSKAAATAHSRRKQTHEWRITQEPAPIEHRPTIHPIVGGFVLSQCHLREMDQIRQETTEKM